MWKRLLLTSLLCLSCAVQAGAKLLQPKVVLHSIKQLKKTERHGDELYLAVTSFPSKGKAKHKRYPNYPLFWPGRNIGQIKEVHLWQGPLEQGRGVRLLISLIEQDSFPWDIDDEIGSVTLRLMNKAGKLALEWEKPNTEITNKLSIKSVKKDLTLTFVGHGQSYEVALTIALMP